MNICIPHGRQQLPAEAWLFGQRFHVVTQEEAFDECVSAIQDRIPSHFVTANLDFLAQSRRRPELKKILQNADRIFCDGMPLIWMSRWFGTLTLPERVTGSDLTPLLLAWCAANSRRVFIIGGIPGELDQLISQLSARFPGLQIAGAISPPFTSIAAWDNASYVQQIRQANPDLLLTAIGFPKQDEWIDRHRGELSVPLSMGIGAGLDFITGKQIRAPKWMQKIGFEWFWRMALEPRRLFRRYAYDFIVLVMLVLRELVARQSSISGDTQPPPSPAGTSS